MFAFVGGEAKDPLSPPYALNRSKINCIAAVYFASGASLADLSKDTMISRLVKSSTSCCRIRLPCVFHRRLEGQHKHSPGSKRTRELIGSEGLAETHLGVPEEARNGVLILRPDASETFGDACR
jgi:hypothetical protein